MRIDPADAYPWEVLERVRDMVAEIRRQGRPGDTCLPTDRERFNLPAWNGTIFGCECLASPVLRSARGVNV